jgi:SH3-like domain-containing protein
MEGNPFCSWTREASWQLQRSNHNIPMVSYMVTEQPPECQFESAEDAMRPAAAELNLRAAKPHRRRYYIGNFSSHFLVRLSGSSRVSCFALALGMAALLAGCGRGRRRVLEVAYVSAPQAALRDQVSALYNRVGTVKNGERVEVVDREKRFFRVRTASGIEGWIEQRYLVDQKTYDGLQKLTLDNQNDPVQAPGILRNDTNLHLTPGRESEHLYQLASGAKVAILKRATAEKQIGAAPPTRPVVSPGAKPGTKAAAGPVLEDWWLVRDDGGRVGWVLARMVDVDAPLDVAQYAEGQRFVAFFVLNEVQDHDKGVQRAVPQYLCVLTEPHDGSLYDYDQIRVFTWNTRKHRYETAYRERGLDGVLPVTVSTETFDKEGTLPIFILRVRDDAGNVTERKYKLNTPIVKRVLAPGEVPLRPARTTRTRRRVRRRG